MKQILENRYIKSFKFLSFKEQSDFIENQETEKRLSLSETFGDNYYCYVGYHSLTRDTQFIISFATDENEDNLNLLFWKAGDLIVLDTGKHLYLVNSDIGIESAFEINTPLVGLYLTNDNNLVILEEAALRVINQNGKTLKNELFDLIEDFRIENDELSIQTSSDSYVFNL